MIPVQSEHKCSIQSAIKCGRCEFKLYLFTEVYYVTLNTSLVSLVFSLFISSHYMAAIAARACERSGAEWSGERSGHISFRAESAFLCVYHCGRVAVPHTGLACLLHHF